MTYIPQALLFEDPVTADMIEVWLASLSSMQVDVIPLIECSRLKDMQL
jgi:hypothetical protein